MPQRILYGRTVVVFFYGLFLLFSDFLGMYSIAGAIFLLFLLLLPWLMRQAISFKLKNTSYRNISFHFTAKIRSFYLLFFGTFFLITLVIILLVPLAHSSAPKVAVIYSILLYIGLLVLTPLFYRSYKSLVINNAWYGTTPFKFNATKKEAISLFIKIGFWALLISLILGVISALAIEFGSNFFALNNLKSFAKESSSAILITLLGTVIYLFSIGLYKGIIDASLSNFIRNHTKLKDGEFQGTIHPLKLAWISASNAIIILFSLGLLYPWSRIRYLKYKIENSHFACKNFDTFLSSGYEKSSPLGEEALDFFDIDIGF